MSANMARFFAVAEPERQCRLRELRIASLLWLGPRHPLVLALLAAVL